MGRARQVAIIQYMGRSGWIMPSLDGEIERTARPIRVHIRAADITAESVPNSGYEITETVMAVALSGEGNIHGG